jgi:hypothetical protein
MRPRDYETTNVEAAARYQRYHDPADPAEDEPTGEDLVLIERERQRQRIQGAE